MNKVKYYLILVLLFLSTLIINTTTLQAKEKVYTFDYTGNYQEWTVPTSGFYDIELWGAQGGNTIGDDLKGGYGAYTKGTIVLSKGTKLYIYVGQKKVNVNNGTTFNGATGSSGGFPGGGATDIRLTSGNWNDFNSLKTRIMVAAGGGSAQANPSARAGAGGGLIGKPGGTNGGGTQTSGGPGSGYASGGFGYGGSGESGGGGYYGGGGTSSITGSSGGSSFISGHNGCNAIDEISTSGRILHSGQPNHYSGYVFQDTVMIDGDGYPWTDVIGTLSTGMPTFDGKSTMVGNANNGYAKITFKGSNILKNLTVENAEIVKEENEDKYKVFIDTPYLDTNIKADIIVNKDFVIGLGETTIEVGKTHYISIIDTNGTLYVIPLEIMRKTFDTNIQFDEFEFEFNKNTFEYNVTIPFETKSLTPRITVPNGVTYTVKNEKKLRTGKNDVIITLSDGIKTIEYKIEVTREGQDFAIKNFAYTGEPQEYIVPQDGIYIIELWGAQGNKTAYGAYTKGKIELHKGEKLYFYVGLATDSEDKDKYTFNNGIGNSGGWNGGGATDVRLEKTANWYDFSSLKSRIMVAGAGGSGTGTMGEGGGLTGYTGGGTTGGTQTTAGNIQSPGYTISTFGVARGGCTGGNGYYPGGGATCINGAGGGSSFISGHNGCNAITETSTESSISHTGQSNHYSGKIFTETKMIDGKGYEWTSTKQGLAPMPNPAGGNYTNGRGHSGNGYARITPISNQIGNDNNYLESLTVDKGILSPAFDKEELNYTLTLDEDDTKIYIEALQEDYDALVIGAGELEIEPGTQSHTITITSPSGQIRNINIEITRTKSTNTNLKGILINGIPLETFNETTLEYEIEVPFYYNKIYVEGVKANEKQTITGEGLKTLTNNQAEAQLLVVSEVGEHNKLYKVKVTKEKSTLLQNVTFKELNLKIDLELNKFDYDIELPVTTHSLEILATPYYEGVTIETNGNKYIGTNSKQITVTSTLEGIPSTTYTFNISYKENPEYYGYNYPYTGDVQTFIAPISANYKMQLWGGSGNGNAFGAYTSGVIYLEKDDILYVYTGKSTTDNDYNVEKFNNGTGNQGGWNGGGSTDIRIVKGDTWKEFASLKSRIMVAGAGGSSQGGNPGAAGGLQGYNGGGTRGGTQTAAGARQSGSYTNSYFGIANGGCTGGNGYYPGGGATCVAGAGGGSSYISGHIGVNSISESSTSSKITHTGDINHYSGYVFNDTKMIDGKGYSWSDKKDELELMPKPEGGFYSLGTGHKGDGYAIIETATLIPNDNFLDTLVVKVGDKIIPFTEIIEETLTNKDFVTWETEYTVRLTKDEPNITIEATPKDILATIEGTGFHEIPPLQSTKEIIVTAQDGTTKTYTIHFEREADNDPYPTNIEIKRLPAYLCKLNPAYCNYTFNKTSANYEIELPYAVREIELSVLPKSKWQEYKYYETYDFDNPGSNTPIETDGVFALTDATTTIYIEVISEDKSQNIVYTYTFNRDVTGNNNLESITITNPNIIVENFDPYTYEYYLTLPTGFSFDIEAIPERKEKTKVEIQGKTMTSEPYKAQVTNLVQGMNNVIITVTAENGDTKTYILHVYKGYESDVLLNSLTVTSGSETLELTPTFDGRLNDYSIRVGSETENINISAVAHDPSGVVVTGLGNQTLESGINAFEITVTSKTPNDNGEYDKNTYNLTIYKDMSSNANISNITIDGYTLDPIYNKETKEYYINLNSGETTLNVNVTMEDSKGTYTIRGNNNLNKSVNEIVITGYAEDKSYVVYRIYALKEVSNNNNLTDLSYKTDFTDAGTFNTIPGFTPDTTNYEINVDSTTRKIEISGSKEHINAVVKGEGIYYLNAGSNIIEIEVTAENNDTKTYTLNVIRAKNDNTNLLTIENNRGSVVTKSDTEPDTYIINVQYEINSIEIKGIPEVDSSIVTGNGIFNLTPGENNIITLRVTSEAGSYKDYAVKVVRDLSNNDDLAFLYIQEGGLQPNFSRTTIFYDILVPNNITNMSELHIEAIPEDKDAKVTISGNDGSLEVGISKSFTITVTAPNKIDTKVYTINVTRQEDTTENLSLESLTTNRAELTPLFAPDTLNYELTVENNITDITVEGVALDKENTIVVGTGKYNLNVGKNLITIFVRSKETSIQKDYQIVVTRKKSNDATLSNIVVSGHTISPKFTSDTTNYSLTTSKDYLTFTTITPTEKEATYIIEGNTSFKTGNNEVKIIVTAPDGETTKEYIINANKAGSKNNNLASLEVIGYTLTPAFHKGVTFYTTDVSNNINSIMIKATPEDNNATISGDGLKSITTGENYFDIIVTSETNAKKTYTILVTKDPSDNNFLATLFSTEGTWNKTFTKTDNNYEITVSNDINEIEFYGTLEDANSTVTGLEKHTLNVGENNIQIIVTSESGLINIYNIKVIREETKSAYLTSLNVTNYDLDPEFNKEILEYFITVNNETTSLDLSYTKEDKNANVVTTGNENFSVGMNEVHITVTREVDETTTLEMDYIIYVNRQMSTNNYLESLYLSVGTLDPTFNKETLNYNVTVPSTTENIIVYATTEDNTSKITSGTGTHTLNPGLNTINVKVRSSIGVTRTYVVNITREESFNNKLQDIIVKNINGDLLTPNITFNPDTNTYDYNLTTGEEYAIISVIKGDNFQTVIGTGPKELNPGTNTFEIIVTAQNGSINTYTLNIINPLSNNNFASMITPSSGTLDPEFTKENTTYNLELEDVSSLSFEVTTESNKATITGNEIQPVPEGNSTRIIKITAEDGSEKEYTINITRPSESNALLETLTIEGYPFEFNPNTFTYNIQVSRSKKTLTESEITAIAKDIDATVNLMGDIELIPDIINVYKIEVIAKDGYTTQEYILNITRDNIDYTIRSQVYDIIRKDGKTNEEEVIKMTEDYVVGGKYSTIIEDYIGNFENEKEMLHIYNQNNEEIIIEEGIEKLIGTSMKITLESKTGYIYDELLIIIRGDITGDGKVNVADQTKLSAVLGKIETLTPIEQIAADITLDGKVNVADQTKLSAFLAKIVLELNEKPKEN